MLTRVIKVQGMAEEAVEDEKISKVNRLSICLFAYKTKQFRTIQHNQIQLNAAPSIIHLMNYGLVTEWKEERCT